MYERGTIDILNKSCVMYLVPDTPFVIFQGKIRVGSLTEVRVWLRNLPDPKLPTIFDASKIIDK